MTLRKSGYITRLIDNKISRHLKVFGAVSLEGPKWCGKTWTALNHAKSATFLTEKNQKEMAMINPIYIFQEQRPQLIDEWQIVPSVWDAIRHECDSNKEKGKFILTGSTSLDVLSNDDIYHSGTGRISIIKMRPMSLYESNDSDGRSSIRDMMIGKINDGYIGIKSLEEIAYLVIRGGWPDSIGIDVGDAGIIAESYIESIVNKDMNEFSDRKRDPQKMKMIIRSLSRNISSLANTSTILRDIEEYENEKQLIESRLTVVDYLKVLEKLYLIEEQKAFGINYRSSSRVGKTSKRHLVDPSLCCASLHLTKEKLLNDLNTFGLIFESMVIRDLRIYAEDLNAELFHFRDNVTGDEVDAIMEFKDGNYAAFEIKLHDGRIQEAIVSLQKFYSNVEKKPIFMCVIVGHGAAIMKDPETNIFITPITSLKP